MTNETKRTCRECGETKAIEEFPQQRKWRLRRCRSCENERIRKWQQDRSAQLRSTERYAAIENKQCARCGETKAADEFARRLNRGVGLDTYCRECRNAYQREKRLNDPTRFRAVERKGRCKSRYGITVEEFDEQLRRQRGCCAICNRHVGRGIHIDHCHTTGKVRGLLCGRCNLAIGKFEDNPALLRAAADYLEKSVT